MLFSIYTATASQLGELRDSYYRQLAQIHSSHNRNLDLLQERFTKALLKSRMAAVEAGSLERVMLIDQEISMWMLDQRVANNTTSDGEVARLRKLYQASLNDLDLRRSLSVIDWQEKFDAALAELIRKLVSEEQIYQARETTAERARIAQSQTVKNARAQSGRRRDQAGHPTFEADWWHLVGINWASKEGSRYFEAEITNPKEFLTFRGKTYAPHDFLYSHAPGKFVFRFAEPITGFRARACMEERSNSGNVVFTVSTDEGEIYRSQPVFSGRRSRDIEVTFQPSNTLVLATETNGHAYEDWAFWLRPQYRSSPVRKTTKRGRQRE